MSNYRVDERLVAQLPAKLSKEGRELCMTVLKGLEGIRSNVERVGHALYDMSEVDRTLFLKNCPSSIKNTLLRCLQVAEGTLHPKLATASGRAAQQLRKLSVDQQDKYMTERIPVALPNGDKKMMDAETMPAELVPQVFAQGGKSSRVRSVDEQRKWKLRKEEEAQKKAERDEARGIEINRPNKWAIKNGRVYLAKKKIDAGLTADDLDAIRKDLKL